MAILSDPALTAGALAADFLRRYRRAAEQMFFVESLALPSVERFFPEDRFLTGLARAIVVEISWPLPAPLVVAMSAQYYWTSSAFNIIGVPAGESRTLLGLPDLCHELGHQLDAHEDATLVGSFRADVTGYVDEEKKRATATQQPKSMLQDIEQVHANWLNTWIPEFVADMVATFIVGPAFGGQHVRLAAGRMSSDVYFPALGDQSTHPADEARLRAIVAVLEELGDIDSAQELKTMWAQYVTLSGEREPPDYSICYPQPLIIELARRVVAGCLSLKIRPFVSAQNPGIQQLLTGSWKKLSEKSDDYGAWEDTEIRRLWVSYVDFGPE